MYCYWVFLYFIVLFLVNQAKSDECETCRIVVSNFISGIHKSAGKNFGGGNSLWEEKHLGSYAISEARFHDIIEEVCKETDKKRLCEHFLEDVEQHLETWWSEEFRHAQNNPERLETYLCVNKTAHCCPFNYYGVDCALCSSCSYIGGNCNGNGTRSGTGLCQCRNGYIGSDCNECDKERYFKSHEYKDGTKVCTSCHISCYGGCSGPLSKHCVQCASGWVIDANDSDNGCVDINECENNPCDKSNEFCLNTEGSFKCQSCDRACSGCNGPFADECHSCAAGFQRGFNETCEDINECNADSKLCRGEGEVCVNTVGSYTCDCKSGFSRIGSVCKPSGKDEKFPKQSITSKKSEKSNEKSKRPDSPKIIWTVTYTKEFLKYCSTLCAFAFFCWLIRGHSVLMVIFSILLGVFVYFQSSTFDYVFLHQK